MTTTRVRPPKRSSVSSLVDAMRPQQWIKNSLVLVPVIAGHRWAEPGTLAAAGVAFASFSLMASSVYLTNDVLDREADRAHPSKAGRAIASGQLTVGRAHAGAAGLAALAIALPVLLLPAAVLPGFLLVLVLYALLAGAYSVALKTVRVLDVLLLALFYVARVLAGGAATSIPVSNWLLAFSAFLFLSLAVCKRHAELDSARTWSRAALSRRGYDRADLPRIRVLGLSSGLCAVLVLGMYIRSDGVTLLYGNPAALWLLCPLLVAWIGRVWVLVQRGELSRDPVLLPVRDRLSLGLVLAGVCILWWAR